MSARSSLLVVDVGNEPLEPLALRLARLGFHTLRAKTGDEAIATLGDARYEVGAVVVPADLPVPDLQRAVAAMRRAGRSGDPHFLAGGSQPDADVRARLRRAGVRFALWQPVDDHTLRFQANRALAGDVPADGARRAERVPTNLPVKVWTGGREKWAKIYSVSRSGAYLATPRPSMVHAKVSFTLPLPGEEVALGGEVVMTNVPGNLVRRNLPIGMGVRFDRVGGEVEQRLDAYTSSRSDQLLL